MRGEGRTRIVATSEQDGFQARIFEKESKEGSNKRDIIKSNKGFIYSPRDHNEEKHHNKKIKKKKTNTKRRSFKRKKLKYKGKRKQYIENIKKEQLANQEKWKEVKRQRE